MKKYIIVVLVIILIVAGFSGIFYLNYKKKIQEGYAIYKRGVEYFNSGNYKDAKADFLEALSKIYKKNDKDKILFYLVKISYRNKNVAEMEKYIEKYSDKNGIYFLKSKYLLARLYIEKNELEKAKKIAKQLVKNPKVKAEGLYCLGLIAYKNNHLKEAQKLFSEVLQNYPDKDFIMDLKFKLGDVNYKLFMNLYPPEDFIVYKVKKGDVLFNICKKYGVTVEIVMKLNHMLKPYLHPSKRLFIPKKKFSILIDKGTHTLELYYGNKFFKIYRVRTGKTYLLTPEGNFKILNKVKNPQWTDPKTGKVYPPGDPENELGTRWMAFYGSSIGIHGTIHPETIGTNSSNGCVGMLMKDVEELYDLVPVGTPIKIINSKREK